MSWLIESPSPLHWSSGEERADQRSAAQGARNSCWQVVAWLILIFLIWSQRRRRRTRQWADIASRP